NGDSILQPYPSVSCYHSSDYLSLKPFFILMLIIILLFPFILMSRLLWLNRTPHYTLFKNSEIKFIYGPLHEAYVKELYYWEIWVLIRRLVVSFVAQIVEPLNLPLKFTVM